MPFQLNRRQPLHPTPRPRALPRTVFDPAVMHVVGMHGMGDNIHQRAIIKQLMQRYTVFLETPWPCIYHELVGERLHLIKRPTALRTQAKNAAREANKYETVSPHGPQLRVWYTGEDVRAADGSIFAAMVRNAKCDVATADFRLPVPTAWFRALAKVFDVHTAGKPIMLYRPLVERTEWQGCAGRNPDHDSYYQLVRSIRDQFFVISVADLVPSVEWMVGTPLEPDLALHHGELTFEALAALASYSSLVFCSPGFATILAQAVGTPVVCVFGGHECSLTIKTGARFAPTLGIDPIRACNCFSHTHPCDKRIDMPQALARLLAFVEQNVCVSP